MSKDVTLAKEILGLKIPSAPEPEVGFLEIIKKSHHENINSNIYGYYLNPENNRTIASVFLKALLDLILPLSGKKVSLDDYTVCLEHTTNQKGRIDIVIKDENAREVVMIENKIHHSLENDLDDYWETFNYKSDNKIGVLLTVNPYPQNAKLDPNFVNITHKQWIDQVKEYQLPKEINHKDHIYLNDFFNTIDQLTNSEQMDHLTEFYFSNAAQVTAANKTLASANRFMDTQFRILGENLQMDVYDKEGAKSGFYRNLWIEKEKSRTYYTVIFDELMTGVSSQILIIIEMSHEDRQLIDEVDKHLDFQGEYCGLTKKINPIGNITHYLHKKYTLSQEQIATFGDTIYQFIQEDFAQPMKTIQEFIKKHKSENKNAV